MTKYKYRKVEKFNAFEEASERRDVLFREKEKHLPRGEKPRARIRRRNDGTFDLVVRWGKVEEDDVVAEKGTER